jgi:uncharacterized membrane protein
LRAGRLGRLICDVTGRRHYNYSIILGCVFSLGAYLRLHLLSTQILLGDEWHSIRAVTGKTWIEVLTQFDPNINSSLPLNLYNLALYHSIGWSELTVRLPVMLAGLLSLVALPLLIKRVFNERVSLVFACLLAIAPFLIFYSRYDRPYGLAALLCFSALLLSQQWLATGRRRYAAGFVMTGLLAIYATLFSIVAVAMPFVTALGFWLVHRATPSSPTRPQVLVSLKSVCKVAAIFAVLLLPLLWPVLRRSGQLPWEAGKLTWTSALTAATLLSGTANGPLNALFFLLLIAGYRLLFKYNLLLGSIFTLTVYAYVMVLLVSRPQGLETGAILLRYMIVVVPVFLTAVALAVDDLLRRARSLNWKPRGLPLLGAAGFFACLYAAGPLPALSVPPNNLTNHAIFQSSYKRPTWESTELHFLYPAFVMKQDQIPAFYNWLRGQSNVAAIVEYPFDICDFNNLFYYYQHFHQKRVLAGYCGDPKLVGNTVSAPPSERDRFTVGILDADEILSAVADPTKLAFRNMVDVADTAALVRSPADFLILHKYIMALKMISNEPAGTQAYGSILVHYQSVDRLQVRFKECWGAPVYEDPQIVCFRIRRPKS